MIFLLVLLYWSAVALFGLAVAEAVLGYWVWASVTFGGSVVLHVGRICIAPTVRPGDLLGGSDVSSVVDLALRLEQQGNREDAEALRQRAHWVLPELHTLRSHRIRAQVVSCLAFADVFLYRETGQDTFADEAEWALLAAMSLPKSPIVRLNRRAIRARLIELYDLRYKTTLERAYATKLEKAWRKTRPRRGMFRSYGIGLVQLQLFRESGNAEHAAEADRYLHKAMSRAKRHAHTAPLSTAIGLDLMRLKTLLDAKAGKRLSEEASADAIKPALRWLEMLGSVEMLGNGTDLVGWLTQPIVEHAPKRRRRRRAMRAPRGERLMRPIVAELDPDVMSKLAELDRREAMLSDRGEASAEELERLCVICGELLDGLEGHGPGIARLRMRVQTSLGLAGSALYFLTKQEQYFAQADQAFRHVLDTINRDKEPQIWGRLLTARGALLTARYWQTQDARYADTAAEALQQALTVIPHEQLPQMWVGLQHQLGVLHASIYGATRDIRNAQTSQEFFDTALAEAKPGSLEWAFIQLSNGYLNAQRHAYLKEQAKDPDEISTKFSRRAETAFLAALERSTPASAKHLWALAQLGLSTLYIDDADYDRHGKLDYLAKAETALSKALSVTSKDDIASAGIWGLAQHELGVVYRERYEETGDESYIEPAERCLTAAISSFRENAPDASDARFGRRVAAEADLAELYTLMGSRRGLPDDKALTLLESAGKDAHVLPFSMKAYVLASLGETRAAQGAWDKAHEAYQEGLTDLAAQITSAHTGTQRLQLMGDYSRLFTLDALALAHLGQPLEAFALLDQGHARVMAEAMHPRRAAGDKSQHGGSTTARRMAFRSEQSFRRAINLPHGDNMSENRREWQLAKLLDRMSEYYEAIPIAAMPALLHWQLVFKRLGNMYHRRRLGAGGTQPIVTDSSVAQLMHSAQDKMTELAEEVAELEWVAGEGPVSADIPLKMWKEMARLVQQQSAQPNVDATASPGPEPPPGTATISLLLTPQDAHAMVLRNGNVDVVPLPGLNRTVLQELTMGTPGQPYEWIVGLREAYERSGGDTETSFGRSPMMPDAAARDVLDALASTLGSFEMSWFLAQDLMRLTRLFAHSTARAKAERVWRETVRTTLELLRQSIWQPINESGALDGISSVLLIPSGLAVALPIHAAAPEELSVAYTPSLNVWRHCASRTRTSARDTLFMAAPTAGSLPYSDLAEQWITGHYRDPTVRRGRQATPEAFCFDSANHAVIHFHGHAYFRPSAPMMSALVCAGGEMTLTDVRRFLDLSASRLVVIGACSAGQTDLRGTGDEFVGLPAGFLQVGAPAVLASMWPVPEASTAFLLDRFYSLWQAGNEEVSIARALGEAARWLRQASKTELLLHLAHSNITPELREAIMNLTETITPGSRQDRADPPPAASQVPLRLSISAAEALRDHPDDPPFAHPVYWAGFAAYGAAVS